METTQKPTTIVQVSEISEIGKLKPGGIISFCYNAPVGGYQRVKGELLENNSGGHIPHLRIRPEGEAQGLYFINNIKGKVTQIPQRK